MVIYRHTHSQIDEFSYGLDDINKLKLVWQTEKLDELLTLVYGKTKCFNKQNEYDTYLTSYIENPGLFELVSIIFKRDIDILSNLFNYDYKEEFIRELRQFNNN
jgi:hypothetical protein